MIRAPPQAKRHAFRNCKKKEMLNLPDKKAASPINTDIAQ